MKKKTKYKMCLVFVFEVCRVNSKEFYWIFLWMIFNGTFCLYGLTCYEIDGYAFSLSNERFIVELTTFSIVKAVWMFS